MNPVAEIIRRRLVALGLPAALLWLAWQRLAERPIRPRPLDLALFSAALSANLLSIFVGPLRLGFPRLMTVLPPGRVAGRAIALTFDDGPHPETTPVLLDSLRAARVHATFFVLAPQLARHPDLACRIAVEGHTLALHGARHQAVALWTAAQIEQELLSALLVFDDNGLPEPRLYRPPYGFKSQAVQRAADQLGLRLVTWSVDPADYNPVGAAEIIRRVLAKVRPGSIVLLHDARSATVEALPELLRRLRGRGYRCIRL